MSIQFLLLLALILTRLSLILTMVKMKMMLTLQHLVQGIPAYLPNGDIRYVNGTSFSAPHVAGLLLMGGIQAGETYELSEAQQEAGMVPDPLALHVPTNGHVCPEPDPIIIEVP